MTRDAVKKLFTDATDEQVTELLNTMNSEIAREKGKADKLKAENETFKAKADEATALAEELQAKAEEAEQGKMTELEKIQKELEKSNARVAELEKASFVSNQKALAMSSFHISSEQAEQVVKDDGTVDFNVLGQIMSEKESAAALAKEQEIAANSTNPNGSTVSEKGDGKSSAVKIVEKLYSNNQNKSSNDIISQYVNGGN